MTADDFRKMLRLFHVEAPWKTLETLIGRTGAVMPDPETTLVGLLRERNNCAHQSSYEVSNLWIRSVPHQLQTIGMGADIAISVAAHEMHVGQVEFFGDENWMSPVRIHFRFAQERSRDWAEILEGNSKASHVNPDKDTLLRTAIGAARGRYQVVVVKDRTLQPVDWIYPELP